MEGVSSYADATSRIGEIGVPPLSMARSFATWLHGECVASTTGEMHGDVGVSRGCAVSTTGEKPPPLCRHCFLWDSFNDWICYVLYISTLLSECEDTARWWSEVVHQPQSQVPILSQPNNSTFSNNSCLPRWQFLFSFLGFLMILYPKIVFRNAEWTLFFFLHFSEWKLVFE